MLTGIRAAEWAAMGVTLLVASILYLVARRRRRGGYDPSVASEEERHDQR
jgi:hypothetical protein